MRKPDANVRKRYARVPEETMLSGFSALQIGFLDVERCVWLKCAYRQVVCARAMNCWRRFDISTRQPKHRALTNLYLAFAHSVV